MLGNKKQLQIRSADGKMIKLSVDFSQDHDDNNVVTNLENELNREDSHKDIIIPQLQ
jgi:hypothetical protein